jgi:transposase-like protein
MIQTKPLTGQCPRCGATAEHLAYHSRYALKSGQMVTVIRCKQHNGTFCDRYGTAFYDLKTPEEKVQRAIQQSLEGICPEAVARIEDVHSTTVQRWIERASQQAKAADREVITEVVAENIELDELHSFAGAKPPGEQEANLDEVGQHWTHVAMVRES